ncbi:MAG: ExbD/TolR family protein [Planctomycetaceae bacterium]
MPARMKQSSEDDEPDITPMIDMTFLLLIFFMVTSTMKPEGALQIPAAKNGVGVTSEDACIVSVFDDEGTPSVYLSDMKRENGPVAPEQVTQYVVERKKKIIIIKADRKVPSGFVEEVARRANEADIEELTFFVAVQDRK